MDTILRHKSFLFASAFLLLSSLFTVNTPHESQHLNPTSTMDALSQTQTQTQPTIPPQPTDDPRKPTYQISHLIRDHILSSESPYNIHEETLPSDSNLDPNCIFCKIITGDAPCFKVYETKHSLAFLARPPVSHGHTLIIPKYHSRTLTDPGLPDEYLADIGPIMKKIALMNNESSYNIIQNNGKPAWQSVDHVHFHVVTKPGNDTQSPSGLVLSKASWPSYNADDEEYARDAARMKKIGRDYGFTGIPDQNLDWYGV